MLKKAHKVTAMNPKFEMFCLYSLDGQCFGCHSLILFWKETALSKSFNSNGTICQI